MTAVLQINVRTLKPDEMIVPRALLEKSAAHLGQCVEALDGVEEERQLLVNFCRAWDAGIAADAEPFDALCAAIEAAHTAGRRSMGLKPFFLQSTGRLLGYASDLQFFAADWAVQKANDQSYQDGHDAGWDQGYEEAIKVSELLVPVHAVGDEVQPRPSYLRKLSLQCLGGVAAALVLVGSIAMFANFPFTH